MAYSSMYLLLFGMALVLAALVTVILSGYGLGKNEGDKGGAKYKVSIAFLVVGLVMYLVGLLLFKVG